ncbi:hypothetical protein M9Y10_028418 [Tritrichomonas musculus]|uniref:Spindle assembly abnormal protein 6 N-terminal domain-containing protein n=1 Tax=Tritrichomonas musculus TaxID=1915356 RepID=A0ABR2KLA1_9EUKA
MTDNESATQDLNEGYVPIYATHIMLKFKSEQFDGQKILKDVVFKIFVLQDNDVLTSVRFQLSDDQELDFLYEADYDSERFEQIKQEQNLEIEFEDFPNVIRQLITTINNQGTDELEEGDYKLSFKDHDTSGEDQENNSVDQNEEEEEELKVRYFIISQKIEICVVEIFKLVFVECAGEKVQRISQSRYDEISAQLKLVDTELKDIKKRLQRQAPKLLQEYQSTILLETADEY